MSMGTMPVVVVVEGSAASLEAAQWAVDESVGRGTWLLLMAVVDPDAPELDERLGAARLQLRSAASLVKNTNPRALVKTEVRVEGCATMCATLSGSASLVCLGRTEAIRGGRLLKALRGVPVPVAIVGHRPVMCSDDRWVLAVMHSRDAAEAVWRAAVAEARLRSAAVMVLAPPGQDPEQLVLELDRRAGGSDLEVWAMPWAADVAVLIAQAPNARHVVVLQADAAEMIVDIVVRTPVVAPRADFAVLVLPDTPAVVSKERPAAADLTAVGA
ncbi:universal stress protein UspA-like protein [Mycolicibacterium tokaiense]|jgi:nucleotide-binding universal stress UspA family protein|uniref:Universal stress protein UspA-like protein n=2 Tax=Mycolicibacterium tokaiense TaxID=39695 RepID=A0A378TRR4_9MYCO|nr:universal stress protein [Mycolicibacterium tokaiense]STZ62336.1 universal stress protein UspA-like protein [Mycolicibacterium tokaiense]